MIYVISKATFGEHEVRDIQCNANWCSCPYSDYALIPDELVEGILATQGYCDIALNADGTEVTSFTARTIPSVPAECLGLNTVLRVNNVAADKDGNVVLKPQDVGAVASDKVANNFTTTTSGYVADARALKTLNDKFDMDLLWLNDSPTSSFGGNPTVTVPINGAPYHMFLIRYKLNASYSKYAMDICLKGDYGWLSAAMGSAGTAGSDTVLVWRELAINANSIVFYNAMKSGKSLDDGPTEDNGWVVPVEIFGIKGGVN